jgi:hypothetical protein
MLGFILAFGALGWTIWVAIAAFFAGLDAGFAGLRKHLVIHAAVILILGALNGAVAASFTPVSPFVGGFLIFVAAWPLALMVFVLVYGAGHFVRRTKARGADD